MGTIDALITRYQQLLERRQPESGAGNGLANQELNLWIQLREALKREVEDFNNGMGEDLLNFESSTPISLTIRRCIDNATLNGFYKASTSSVSFSCSAPCIICNLSQRPQAGSMNFIYQDLLTGRESVNKVDDIAFDLLERFLC